MISVNFCPTIGLEGPAKRSKIVDVNCLTEIKSKSRQQILSFQFKRVECGYNIAFQLYPLALVASEENNGWCWLWNRKDEVK